MKISTFARLIPHARITGDANTAVHGIEMDSRRVQQGDLFVCVPGVPGFIEDRHHFAADAVHRGAVALVVEKDVPVSVPKIFVNDTRFALALFSCHFNAYPSNALKLIGVTGTNGKTTTAHMIEYLLRAHGNQTGLMGNFGCRVGDEVFPSHNNTEEPPALQRNLRKMADLQTEYAIMEVTSQGLDMGRVMGCDFHTAVFTNLTQDHLDYHGSMDGYKNAKSLLFARLGNTFGEDPTLMKTAVLNGDDAASETFKKVTAAQVLTYGIQNASVDVRAANIRLTAQGTTFDVTSFAGKATFATKLVGIFNVYNALAAITTALAEGIELSEVKTTLSAFTSVPGRMEVVDGSQDFLVLVDYAHTPDGLENVLKTIAEFSTGRVITVFGCGGERDAAKRPIMGGIAAKYSDIVVLTSDNPREEDPEKILDDIETGLTVANYDPAKYSIVPNRQTAIELAVERARPGDVVLIAGKGDETYQILSDGPIHFDDREAARAAIAHKPS